MKKKNILIFRTDRLGDYIIHSRPIFELKKKIDNSYIIIVCSEINKKILNNQSYIDELIIYDKNYSFLKKIKIFFKIIKKKYYACFVVDGKKFSYFCNIFLKSKYKLGISYRKIIKLFNLEYVLFNSSRIYNYLFFNKVSYFTSKKYLNKSENLCDIYLSLFNYFNLSLTNKNSYIFENKNEYENIFKKLKLQLNLNDYLLFHMDEKWIDINNIKKDLYNELNFFQKKLRKKIIITSFKNTHDYYLNLKNNFNILEDNISLDKNNPNIILFENSDIYLFEKFIGNSYCSVSCHSGFLVQVSGVNKNRVIDIINKKDFIWYSCWKPLNTKHKFIYKSINNAKVNLNAIMNEMNEYIEKEINS